MRKLFVLAVVLVLGLSLIACGSGNGNSGGSSSSDKFEYGNGTDYIANNLKGDYSITYKYSSSGDDFLEITCARTSSGYYYKYAELEVLYIKNGSKYDTYYNITGNGFTKVTWIDPKTEDDVKSEFMFITGFMTHYGSNASDMTKIGSETVAGRNCDKYKYAWSYLGSSVQYTYCIDKATGVCLKYTYDVASGGQSGNLSFECTAFKTSGITLPSYN